MSTDHFYDALGVDQNLQSVIDIPQANNATDHFSATITPPLPSGTERITADYFWYEMLAPGFISVLGRSGTGGAMQQLGVIFSKDTPDGIHPLVSSHREGVRADVIEGSILRGTNGYVSFTRNPVEQTIEGKAEFTVVTDGEKEHTVKEFKFLLKASGPLE
jgi:hypothetical protein